MDGSNWKRILLHWTNQTGLFERVYYNIEQTDVDVFFEKFCSQMKTAPIPKTDLLTFLKEKYPDFEVHLDDGNNLCSPDFMYVYSLLLHYSCVKCPEPFFHEACQSLPDQFQQAIASFFKILIESDNFDRENLRNAIHTSSPKSPIRFMPLESPIRTPRSKISPPTPKTTMLEERTREMNSLKAQLESERYERGFVELQLKQNEEKIQKLMQDQKANLAEIYNLKNELLAKNTENHSPTRNAEEEQIKKRLRKNIAEKEEAILNLRENLESLGEEKAILLQKLTYAESQVTFCLDKIKEMDYIINELKSEIEKRDLTIQTLTDTKNELELFITESRSSSQGGRNDFNMSVECLDVSLTRTTNSSGSILSSPENLGVSVVDIKLREKENENVLLCERIEQMQGDCEKLSKHVYDLIVRYADTFDICNENLVVTDDANLTHTFMVFENYIEKMIESYRTANTELKSVREENADIQMQNAIIIKKISGLEEQLEMSTNQLQSLNLKKTELEDINLRLSEKSAKYAEEIKDLSQKYANVQSNLDDLNKEYENQKQTLGEKVYQLTAENFKIESRLNETLKNLEVVTKEKYLLEEGKRNCEDNISKLTETLTEHSEKIKHLEESNGNLLMSIAAHIEQIRQCNQTNEELECARDKLEGAIEKLNEEKDALLDDKNDMLNKLNSSASELADLKDAYEKELQHNNQLKNEIEKISNELCETQQMLKLTISNNKEIEEKITVSNKLIDELNATVSDLTQKRDNYEKTCRGMEEKISALNTQILESDENIKRMEEEYQGYQKNVELEFIAVKNEKDKIEENYKQHVESLNKAIEQKSEEKQSLEDEMLKIKKEVESLTVELEKIEENKNLAEKQLVDEKQEIQQKCDLILSKNSEIEKEMASLVTCLTNHDSSGGDSGIVMTNNIENPISYLKERISSLLTTNIDLSKSEADLRSIISDLKNQMLDMKRCSEELIGTRDTLTEELNESKYQVNCLENEKITLNNEIDELSYKLKELQKVKLEFEEKRIVFENTLDKLKVELKIVSSERDCLLETVSNLQNKEIALEQTIKELEERIEAHVQREGVMSNKVAETEKYLSESTEKQLLLNEKLEKQDDFIELLNKERNILKKELEARLEKSSKDDAKIEALQDENVDLTDQINQLNNELESAKIIDVKLKVSLDENISSKKIIEEKEQSLQAAMKEIQEITESLAVLKASQKNLEESAVDREVKVNTLEEVILGREVRIKELNEMINEKNIRMANLEGTIENLEQTVKEKDTCIEEWRRLLQTADADSKNLCEKYKETVGNLENRLNAIEDERAHLAASNKAMQDNLSEMEDSLNHAQAVNVELLARIDELKSSNAEVTQRETEHINLQLRFVALSAEKEQLRSSKQRIEETCTKLTKRVEKLSIKVGDLQANASKLEKMNSEARNELETLQKNLQFNKTQMEELRIKVDVSQKELKAANEENNKLRKIVNEKTNENAALAKEMEETCKRLETSQQTVQRDLKVANERASNLQILYNEEVAKTVMLNNELEQIRSQLHQKLLEIENQSSNLKEIQAELSNKMQSAAQLTRDLAEIKGMKEQLVEENENLAEKVKLMISTEVKLKEALATVEDLKGQNNALTARLRELSTSEENFKEATSHIDNIKHELELKVEKLSSTLEKMSASLETAQVENNCLQKENVELRIKIECACELAKHIVVKTEMDSKPINDDSIEGRYQNLVQNIKHLSTSKEQTEDSNSQLSANLEACREENTQLSDKLSKLSLRLQILEKENVQLQNDMKDLQTAYDSVRVQRDELENENQSTLTTLQEMQARQNEILHEKVFTQDNLKEQVECFQFQLSEKTHTIELLQEQLETMTKKDESKTQEYLSQKEQFQKLEEKFHKLEQQITLERKQNEILRKDIAIFQAKLTKNREITEEKEKQWKEERSKLEEEIKLSESRIKDNRLELEGKLEKMKNKMKTLYNDEVTKIKSKQEREIAEYKTKVESLLTKNEKYEAHVQKLAKQLFNLNENNLELQKQNKFMETKLKDFESLSASTLRRQSQFASQMIGTNLRMEDEEGEFFNNTFLADLKSGRMSPFGRESVSINELHYRNSLAPPHLRSTYIAQYPDHHLREEDIKDVPINLDDSLSSLLNAGQRKKISGTTSYKKPGPPTPSKNGGRLSFGGGVSYDAPREILKECNDISVNSLKRTTPSKFRTLFSSSKIKDELLTLILDRNAVHRKHRKSITRPLNNQHFTSTPRKSRIYFDQRRHLEQLMCTESCGSEIGTIPFDSINKKTLVVAKKKDVAVTDKFTKWRQSKLPSTDSCTTSDSNSPCVAEKDDAVFVETAHKVSIHNRKERRSSFVLRGNMFAKRKTAHISTVRENLRNKAKLQRSLHFNKYRKSLCNESLIKLRKSILDRLSSIEPASATGGKESLSEQDSNIDLIIWPTRDSIEKDTVDGDSELFERLLALKESNAPFEVSTMNLTPNSLSRQTSLKTLYSGSVIKNRKIPHVNTTVVEKTPEKLKNRKITVVHIIRNWHKLDVFVKAILIVSFMILAVNILIGITVAK